MSCVSRLEFLASMLDIEPSDFLMITSRSVLLTEDNTPLFLQSTEYGDCHRNTNLLGVSATSFSRPLMKLGTATTISSLLLICTCSGRMLLKYVSHGIVGNLLCISWTVMALYSLVTFRRSSLGNDSCKH